MDIESTSTVDYLRYELNSDRVLLKHALNMYSQSGEDGIIARIFAVLERNAVVLDKWCVDIGCSDGTECSNTRALIEQSGYSALLVDADREHIRKCLRLYEDNLSIAVFHEYATPENIDELILSVEFCETQPTKNFDFLSIDVDGMDYYLWEALKIYSPKVVCIEYNITCPAYLGFVQEPDFDLKQGASLLSLVELGKRKGYELVCVTRFNAIFVKREHYGFFGIQDNRPMRLRPIDNALYCLQGYDGTIVFRGSLFMPWHDIYFGDYSPIPRYFRDYPPNFSRVKRWLWKWYRKFYVWRYRRGEVKHG